MCLWLENVKVPIWDLFEAQDGALPNWALLLQYFLVADLLATLKGSKRWNKYFKKLLKMEPWQTEAIWVLSTSCRRLFIKYPYLREIIMQDPSFSFVCQTDAIWVLFDSQYFLVADVWDKNPRSNQQTIYASLLKVRIIV